MAPARAVQRGRRVEVARQRHLGAAATRGPNARNRELTGP